MALIQKILTITASVRTAVTSFFSAPAKVQAHCEETRRPPAEKQCKWWGDDRYEPV
jgi:hypothetical protein